MGKTIEGRLAYADLLRTAALLAAIVLNLAAGGLEAAAVSSPAWAVCNVYNGLTRWCAPAFLMLSGMFLLDPKKALSPGGLLGRILHVIAAAALWTAAYGVTAALLSGGALTWEGVRGALYAALMGNPRSALWFFYLLLGLYLTAPLLRAFVRGAGRAALHYFFLLDFLFAFLLPTLLRLRPNAALSGWLAWLELPLAASWALGYLVAGCYLKTYTINRAVEFLLYLLGALGAAATVWGTAVLSGRAGGLVDNLFRYDSPTVALCAVAVFVLFRYVLGVSEERSRRARMSGVARVSLGVYLAHLIFALVLRHFGVTIFSFTPALAVPVLALLLFLPSFALAWLISKIPFLGRYLT